MKTKKTKSSTGGARLSSARVSTRTSNRGFAAMDADRQREIASMGGKAVTAANRSFSRDKKLAVEAGRKGGMSVEGHKRSFSTNRELASKAGKKGGQSVPDEKRSFSQNPELAAEAGRKGGAASHAPKPVVAEVVTPEEGTPDVKNSQAQG